jgi:hypothetical protein
MTQVYDQPLQTSCVHLQRGDAACPPPGHVTRRSRHGSGDQVGLPPADRKRNAGAGLGHKRGGADGTEGSDGTAQRRAGRRRGAARRGRLRGASVRSGPRRSLGDRRDRVRRRRSDAHPARGRPPPRLAAGRRHLSAHGRAGRHPGRRRVALVRRRAPTARLPRAGRRRHRLPAGPDQARPRQPAGRVGRHRGRRPDRLAGADRPAGDLRPRHDDPHDRGLPGRPPARARGRGPARLRRGRLQRRLGPPAARGPRDRPGSGHRGRGGRPAGAGRRLVRGPGPARPGRPAPLDGTPTAWPACGASWSSWASPASSPPCSS